jgi:HPt (histidine-containing phosphotransfer) domain-containing protein
MNDYLSKPFTLDALDAVLGRWAAARNQPVPVRPPGAPPPPPCIPGCEVDFSGLDQLVRFAGHQALSDVAKAFLNDIPIQLQSLQAAQASGQADRLRQVAHRLKGACGTAGLVGAQRLAAALEVSAKTGDLGSSEADCARLIESVHCGSTRLRQHIDAG